MKFISAPYLSTVDTHCTLEDFSLIMNDIGKHCIATVPWPSYSYKPDVSFAIAHLDKAVLIKFFVAEHSVKAAFINDNDPVYKDSCVEFFISFNNEREYYNFEFNCIGTCLAGFGCKEKRHLLPSECISEIIHLAAIKSIGCLKSYKVDWELMLIIPVTVFHYHKINSLKGLQCKVNFFKCGDDLEEPHYLAWNKVVSEVPDFHLPEYFGVLQFEAPSVLIGDDDDAVV